MADATLDTTKLSDRLVGTVDRIRRRVHARLGTRPFVVSVIRRTWDGPCRGDGDFVDVALVLDPPPAVMRRGLRGAVEPAGLEEQGGIYLREISLRYSEEELYLPKVAELEEFYYRITDAHGQKIRSRYYVPSNPPTPDRDGSGAVGWSIDLTRVEDVPNKLGMAAVVGTGTVGVSP